VISQQPHRLRTAAAHLAVDDDVRCVGALGYFRKTLRSSPSGISVVPGSLQISHSRGSRTSRIHSGLPASISDFSSSTENLGHVRRSRRRSRNSTELLIVDERLHRRMVPADRAFGIPAQPQRPELHRQCIKGEESASE
jgi:hypothetical protein